MPGIPVALRESQQSATDSRFHYTVYGVLLTRHGMFQARSLVALASPDLRCCDCTRKLTLFQGPVPFTVCSEVFPLEYRLAGMSLGVSTNLFGAGLLALFVPIVTSTGLHNIGLTSIFAGTWFPSCDAAFARLRRTHEGLRSSGF